MDLMEAKEWRKLSLDDLVGELRHFGKVVVYTPFSSNATISRYCLNQLRTDFCNMNLCLTIILHLKIN